MQAERTDSRTRARALIAQADTRYDGWTAAALAEDLGVSLGTAQRIIRELLADGTLEVYDRYRPGPGGNAPIYCKAVL